MPARQEISKGRIGDVCLVGDGAHAIVCRQSFGVLYLTSKNLKSEGLDLSKVDFISEETYEKLFKDSKRALVRPEPMDVLFGIIGSIGVPYLIREGQHFGISSSIAILRPDQTVLNPSYLFYWIKGDIFQRALYGIKGGVAQGYVSLEMIRSLPLHYPPLPVQRRIVSILSAYDDLIENNTRRIKILEEIARLIYREWFVEFRAPGVKLRKATPEEWKVTGKDVFPVGWEVKRVGDAIETLGGSTPSTKNPEYWDNGDITWFTPSDLTANKAMFIRDSSKRITRLGLEKSSSRLFPPYSVMMTSRATIGVTAINTTEACTNQGFITCIPNDRLSAYHIYFWIEQNLDQIINVASGATYKEINRTEFRDFLITVPDEATVSRFVGMVGPVGKLIETLSAKNVNLRQTRDLLLPRLMGGEIGVNE